MPKILFTAAAASDAAAIYAELYAKAGQATVLKYRALFARLYRRLAEFPDSGAPRAKLGRNIRISVISPYIILYRHAEADDLVIVLRLLHGRRKISGKMLRGGPRPT